MTYADMPRSQLQDRSLYHTRTSGIGLSSYRVPKGSKLGSAPSSRVVSQVHSNATSRAQTPVDETPSPTALALKLNNRYRVPNGGMSTPNRALASFARQPSRMM